MADTDTLPSLMLSAAMCEWQSMMPGITNCPAASMIWASGGIVTFSPTSAILPLRIKIDPSERALGHRQHGRIPNDYRRRGQHGRRKQP